MKTMGRKKISDSVKDYESIIALYRSGATPSVIAKATGNSLSKVKDVCMVYGNASKHNFAYLYELLHKPSKSGRHLMTEVAMRLTETKELYLSYCENRDASDGQEETESTLDEQEMKDLKPCPFCGEDASLWYKETNYGRIAYAECDLCGAKSKAFRYYDCGAAFNLDDVGAIRARTSWNRRSRRARRRRV